MGQRAIQASQDRCRKLGVPAVLDSEAPPDYRGLVMDQWGHVTFTAPGYVFRFHNFKSPLDSLLWAIAMRKLVRENPEALKEILLDSSWCEEAVEALIHCARE